MPAIFFLGQAKADATEDINADVSHGEYISQSFVLSLHYEGFRMISSSVTFAFKMLSLMFLEAS